MALSDAYTSHDFSHGTYYPAQATDPESIPSIANLDTSIDYNNITTVTSGDNPSITTSSHSTYSTTELSQPKFAGDVLGTAKNNGSPAQGNLKPTSVCMYQGMEVSLDQLARLGVVYQHQDSGRWIQTDQADQQASSSSQPTPHTPDPTQTDPTLNPLAEGIELFDTNIEQAYANSVNDVPEAVFQNTVAKCVASGDLEELNYSEIGRDSGMSPEQAYKVVQEANTYFTNQANTLAKSMGVSNPIDCWNWLSEHKPQMLATAQNSLVTGRSTTELRKAIDIYTSKVPANAELLQQRGYETKKGHNGEVLVKIGNMWTTPISAKKAGLIK